MKAFAHYADPAAASEPLPENVQQWVDETNADGAPAPTSLPAYDGNKKLVIEIRGEAPSTPQHWAQR